MVHNPKPKVNIEEMSQEEALATIRRVANQFSIDEDLLFTMMEREKATRERVWIPGTEHGEPVRIIGCAATELGL